jgi:pilus assembly protein Flp/PilA
MTTGGKKHRIFQRKEVNTMLFAPKEKGQGLVEYALILVLVAIVVIAVLMLLGPIIGNVFSTINDSLSSAT